MSTAFEITVFLVCIYVIFTCNIIKNLSTSNYAPYLWEHGRDGKREKRGEKEGKGGRRERGRRNRRVRKIHQERRWRGRRMKEGGRETEGRKLEKRPPSTPNIWIV